MPDSVQMPALGESVTEGTVTRWLKQVGDTVEVDEPLLEVSTDKVDTEIPSPVAGTLLEILVQEDDTVEVGTELARIGSADEAGGAQGGQDEQPAEGADAASEQQAAQVPQEVTAAPQGAGPVEEPDAAGGQGEPTQQAAAPQEPAKVAGGGSAGGGDAQDVTLPALGE